MTEYVRVSPPPAVQSVSTAVPAYEISGSPSPLPSILSFTRSDLVRNSRGSVTSLRVHVPAGLRGMWSGRGSRAWGVAALLILAGACGGPPTKPPPSAGGIDGTYTGKGNVNLTFVVGPGGNAVTQLQGDTGFSCASSTLPFQALPFNATSHSTAITNNNFDDSFTVGDGNASAEFRFQGTLDGHGGASGSLTVKEPGCKADGTWSAALPGHTQPAPPNSAPPVAPAAVDCSPQPCGVASKVTLSVGKVAVIPAASNYPSGGIALTATFTNNDNRSHGVLSNNLTLQTGSSTVPAGLSPPLGTDGVGTIDCSSNASIDPGSTSSAQTFCFPFSQQIDSSAPLTLVWHADNEDQQSTIPLPTPTG